MIRVILYAAVNVKVAPQKLSLFKMPSDVQLEKKTLNIPYKQVAFLQNEFSYRSADDDLEKKT